MSKRMQLKGFTLIELLAVIVIIAVVATITTPIINGVLNNANEKSFLDSALSINKAANNYYAENSTSLFITFDGSKNALKYTGKSPDSGNVYIDNDGNVTMAIYDDKSGKCAYKSINDKTPTLKDIEKKECKLDN